MLMQMEQDYKVVWMVGVGYPGYYKEINCTCGATYGVGAASSICLDWEG